jgi:regulatory protein
MPSDIRLRLTSQHEIRFCSRPEEWAVMKITAIVPNSPRSRAHQHYNLYLDGHPTCKVTDTLISELGLTVGMEMSHTELAELRSQVEEGQLLERALRFLAPRPRSRAEVRRRLLKPSRGGRLQMTPDPLVVERILDRLEALELLDDRQFADFWVENRERFNPRSARALAQELRQRGVASETIEQVSKPEDDEARALAAGRRRLHTFSNLSYPDFRVRLGQFLLRRGFNYQVIQRVLRQLWEEAEDL